MVISTEPLTETKVLFENNTTQPSAFIMTGVTHSAEIGLYNFLLISTRGEGTAAGTASASRLLPGGSLPRTVPAAGGILLGSRQWSLPRCLSLAQGNADP